MPGVLLDAAVVALFVGLAWLGARRGAAESGLRLAALFVAYGAAVLAATGLGGPAAARLGLPPAAGMLLAGTGAFALAYLAVGRAAAAVGRAERQAARDGRPAGGSRLLGGVFGGLRAAVLLLPLLWLAHVAQGLGEAEIAPALPDLSGARLPGLGGAAARAGAAAVVDEADPAQRVRSEE
ncbi:MAG: CvpA family protein, partial [Myxococcota bacterium]|nr:CvpA family protein [Myxococcota bacterium]